MRIKLQLILPLMMLFVHPVTAKEHEVIVKKGENLLDVANRCNVTPQELIQWNKIKSPYNVYIGQPLKFHPKTNAPVKIADALKRTGEYFSWPVKGEIISTFGPKKTGLTNDGINIEVNLKTPVNAAEDGVVVYAGNGIRGFGNMILIKHGEGWTTTYAHNDLILVAKGEPVKRGQEIAKSGNSGQVDTPQVHFEIRHESCPVDPMLHLK